MPRLARNAWLLLPLVTLLPGGTSRAANVAVTCDTGALRDAIRTANANPGPDTLRLATGCTYLFTEAGDTTDLGFWYGPTASSASAAPTTT